MNEFDNLQRLNGYSLKKRNILTIPMILNFLTLLRIKDVLSLLNDKDNVESHHMTHTAKLASGVNDWDALEKEAEAQWWITANEWLIDLKQIIFQENSSELRPLPVANETVQKRFQIGW